MLLDLARLTQIYLKYHGLRFAALHVNYDEDLYLSFKTTDVEKLITSHSVLLQKPVHIADMRITLVPELIKVFDNYDVTNGEHILPRMYEVRRKIFNED